MSKLALKQPSRFSQDCTAADPSPAASPVFSAFLPPVEREHAFALASSVAQPPYHAATDPTASGSVQLYLKKCSESRLPIGTAAS